jgi:hypothetical protein
VVTLSIEAASSSTRGPGQYAFTWYTDTDSLDLQVGLNLYPVSEFRAVPIASGSAEGNLVRWTAHPDFAYQVQYSDTGQEGDWHDIGALQYVSTGETALSYLDTSSSTALRRLYRLRRTLIP